VQSVLRAWAGTDRIGGRKVTPRRSLAGEAVERSGLLQVLFRRRFPPEFLDAFVNNRQERRETCKQEEEKIQVGMLPIHVQTGAKPKRMLVSLLFGISAD